MRKNIAGYICILLVSALNLFAQEPRIIWSKEFGGTDEDRASSICETNDGCYMIAGETSSIGAGKRDVWLFKIDGDGNKLWEKTYGGEDSDWGTMIKPTQDGGFIISASTASKGAGRADMWLLKTDSAGVLEWDITFGGEDIEWGQCVHETSGGGFLFGGSTESFGAGKDDIFLVAVDNSGSEMWRKTFGTAMDENVCSVIETEDGNFALCGRIGADFDGLPSEGDIWLIKTNTQGDVLWEKTYGGSSSESAGSMVQTSDGGYMITGMSRSYGRLYNWIWLVKTDAHGEEQWQKIMWGTDGSAIRETSDGGYIITGYSKSGSRRADLYVLKIDTDGNKVWDRSIGGDLPDWGHCSVETSDGACITAGSTYSYGQGRQDAFLVKLKFEE